jgi:hypothetical protein
MSMNISEKIISFFEGLSLPADGGNEFTFRTKELIGSPKAWIGKDAGGCPVVLVSVEDDGNHPSPRVKLPTFTYQPQVRCVIKDDTGAELEMTLAVLLCRSEDRDFQIWFLRAVGVLIQGLATPLQQSELDRSVARLVQLLGTLGRSESRTIQGLWGELLLIAYAQDPDLLLRAWHDDRMEIHDFIAGNSRLEVKTATGQREHHFSLEQLDCSEEERLAVASLLLRPTPTGSTVVDLMGTIEERVKDPGLSFKLYRVVSATLGSDWRRAADLRYSVAEALDSLLLFDSSQVPRVSGDIPPEVRDVSFVVDVSGVQPLSGSESAAIELWAALSVPQKSAP